MTPIVFVSSLAMGGTERVALTFFSNLRKSYPDSKLFVFLGSPPVHLSEKNIVAFNSKSIVQSIYSLLRIIDLLRGRNIIIYSFSEYSNALISLLRMSRLVKCPIILRSSTVLSALPSGRLKIRSRLFGLTYRAADCVICQSQMMKSDLIESFKISPEKLNVIYNPIMRDSASTHSPMAETEHLKYTGGHYCVVVGNLRREKGHERLIELYERAPITEKLVIVGSGENESRLTNIIKSKGLGEQIVLLGEMDNPMPLIANAVALIVPSYFEGYPNVAIEATYCSTPIIGFSDCSVMREIIEDGVNGFIVDPSDPLGLDRAIHMSTSLFRSNSKRQELIERHDPHKFHKSCEELIKHFIQ
jgi:glycosyltransferase involved in cell wall biosynthesis